MKAIKEPAPRQGGSKQRGPDEIPVLAWLAARHLKYGAWENARVLYTLLVSLRPRRRAWRTALGYACFKTGRAEEALAHLEAAFKGRRDLNGWETLLFGRTLRANGMMDESQALLAAFLAAKENA